MFHYFENLIKEDSISSSIYKSWLESQLRYLQEIDAAKVNELGVDFWLHKSLRYFFPYEFLIGSPFQIPDMYRAVSELKTAYDNRQQTKIVIYGDRDADGVCSTSLLHLFLKQTVEYPSENLISLVPREDDMYGIADSVVERIVEHKPDLLFTLDCGSMNRETLAQISEKTNCKIIVLDHHFIPEDSSQYPALETATYKNGKLYNAEGAFVNPKRLTFPDSARDYCTTALVWQFTRAFTYSFTPEMDRIHRVIEGDIIRDYKNGVPLPETVNEQEVSRIYDFNGNNPGESINGTESWEQLKRNNRQIYQLDKFISSLDNSTAGHFHAGHKYQILKHFGMQKVAERVRPYLSFAALGLVADLMPLWDDNRIILAEGLRLMSSGSSELPMGLRELLRRQDLLGSTLSEQDLGFSICPVINAAGRLGRSEVALGALIETDPLQAAEKTFLLKKINEERKELTKTAINIIRDENLISDLESGVAIVHHPGLHRGISGLLASRVAEECGVPAIVLVEDGGALRGSIRAARNENVFALLVELKEFFVQFGGHRQAAGFTLPIENLDQFKLRARQLAKDIFTETETVIDDIQGPVIEMGDSDLRSRLWEKFLRFAPYGIMNPHPTLKIKMSSDVSVANLGKTMEHAKVTFSAVSENSVEGVWFFHGGRLDSLHPDKLRTVYAEPHLNRFAGRLKYQLRIKKIDAL